MFLVEGTSEELFYKALAKEIGIDLDRLNISVLSVGGVGFIPYINLLQGLGVPVVVRTDHDINKIQGKGEYRCAGFERAINIYEILPLDNDKLNNVLKRKDELKGLNSSALDDNTQRLCDSLRDALVQVGIFMSKKDLENDLVNSGLKQTLEEFFKESNYDKLVAAMQDKKASSMYKFLLSNTPSLVCLKDSSLAAPLKWCRKLAEPVSNETNESTS